LTFRLQYGLYGRSLRGAPKPPKTPQTRSKPPKHDLNCMVFCSTCFRDGMSNDKATLNKLFGKATTQGKDKHTNEKWKCGIKSATGVACPIIGTGKGRYIKHLAGITGQGSPCLIVDAATKASAIAYCKGVEDASKKKQLEEHAAFGPEGKKAKHV
jgi:hypothetical protein